MQEYSRRWWTVIQLAKQERTTVITVTGMSFLNTCLPQLICPKADIKGDTVLVVWLLNESLLSNTTPRNVNVILDCKDYVSSVSARPRHCGNPALHSGIAPRKTEKGPIEPFTLTRLHAGLTQAYYFNSHPKAQNCIWYGRQWTNNLKCN